MRGGTTNRAFLLGLLDRPEVLAGDVDIGWLDRLAAAGQHLPRAHLEVALLQAAVEAYEDELAVELDRVLRPGGPRSGRRSAPRSATRSISRPTGSDTTSTSTGSGHRCYRVVGAAGEVELRVERTGTFERRLTVNGRSYRVLSVHDGQRHLVEVDGVAHRISREAAGT